MIQTFRQIRSRMRGIENTRKITRAMEMVSASKLNKTKVFYYAMRNFFSSLEPVVKNLFSDMENPAHPFLEDRKDKRNLALCVIASDTGLCGAYNHTILNYAGQFLKKRKWDKVSLVTVGKEAYSHFRKQGLSVTHTYVGLSGKYSAPVSEDIANNLRSLFLNKDADEVYIIYTHFMSSLRHAPTAEKLLNIEYEKGGREYYILEPDRTAVMNALLEKYITARMRLILLDTFTAEHSARMLAMKTATDNADDMLDMLTILRNKARQGAITKEMLEISMSVEALKGQE